MPNSDRQAAKSALRTNVTLPRIRLQATLSKDEGRTNQDATAFNLRKRVIAIADGATVSYAPATWARLLVRSFVAYPSFSPPFSFHASASRRFTLLYDRDTLSWNKQASFDRGTFSTLLGLRLSSCLTRLSLLAFGDSLAVVSIGKQFLRSFPYTTSAAFSQRPLLLSAPPMAHVPAQPDGSYAANVLTLDIPRSSRVRILLMTDALGQWFLRALETGDAPTATLLAIRDARAFRTFVRSERLAGRLVTDDTTLLIASPR